MKGFNIRVLGTGKGVTEHVLTNAMLEGMLETSDEWIVSHTGIRERRVCKGETSLELSLMSAKNALEASGVDASALGFILCCTISPDTLTPSLACALQGALGANCPAMDINAACSGFLYGLFTAGAMMPVIDKPILIVGTERITNMVDWSDRSTCVLFGDGSGAAVVAPGDGMPYARVGAYGEMSGLLNIPGTNHTVDGAIAPSHLLMGGPDTYKAATRIMAQDAKDALEALDIRAEDIARFVPHQANFRIIKTVADRLHMPLDRFYINIDRYGNTSNASIPIALDELYRGGTLAQGDLLMLNAFGGGMTSGCVVLRV